MIEGPNYVTSYECSLRHPMRVWVRAGPSVCRCVTESVSERVGNEGRLGEKYRGDWGSWLRMHRCTR